MLLLLVLQSVRSCRRPHHQSPVHDVDVFADEPSPPEAAPAALAHKLPARASPAMSRAARDFFNSAVSGSAGSGRVPLPVCMVMHALHLSVLHVLFSSRTGSSWGSWHWWSATSFLGRSAKLKKAPYNSFDR
jgi:hypothetical protein